MAALVMTVRFLCELAALAALAAWGYRQSGVVVAFAAPLFVAVVWGRWIAPRAAKRLRDPARFATEACVWIAATAALVLVAGAIAAATFGIVAFGSAILARRYEPAVHALRSNGASSSRAA